MDSFINIIKNSGKNSDNSSKNTNQSSSTSSSLIPKIKFIPPIK